MTIEPYPYKATFLKKMKNIKYDTASGAPKKRAFLES